MASSLQIQSGLLGMVLRYGSVNRPAAIQALDVRPASLLEAVDALKARGVLCEPARGGVRTGRKAPQLELAPDYFWSVGVDFREDTVIGVVTDMTGAVRHSVENSCGDRQTPEACWGDIYGVLDKLKVACGAEWRLVRCIGFADPGLVDIEAGKSLRAVNLPGWQNNETRKCLEDRYGLSAYVWPEANASTYMEYLQRGKDLEGSLFSIGMGTGIGGGFVKDGKCFFGDNNLAMEVGHVVVKQDGPLCQCGNRGCLEAIVGKNGIMRSIRETLQSGVNTTLSLQNFSLTQFAKCAETDKAARMIATEVCESIGRALAVVVTLLNPTHIVLRGELTGLGDFLLNTVQRVLEDNCFPRAVKRIKLELSTLKQEDTARGAAMMARNRIVQREFCLADPGF